MACMDILHMSVFKKEYNTQLHAYALFSTFS